MRVALTLALIYVLRYGAKIKRDPVQLIMAGDGFSQHAGTDIRPAHPV